jgi:hypothetical protein
VKPCRPARKPQQPTAPMAAPAAANRMRPNLLPLYTRVPSPASRPTLATVASPAGAGNAIATTPTIRPKRAKEKRLRPVAEWDSKRIARSCLCSSRKRRVRPARRLSNRVTDPQGYRNGVVREAPRVREPLRLKIKIGPPAIMNVFCSADAVAVAVPFALLTCDPPCQQQMAVRRRCEAASAGG